jgi:hypothetical protein
MDVSVSTWISHLPALKDSHPDKSFAFFCSNDSFDAFVTQRVNLYAVEGSINNELFTLIEFYIRVEHEILRNLQIFFNIEFFLIFMCVHRKVDMLRMCDILLDLDYVLDVF